MHGPDAAAMASWDAKNTKASEAKMSAILSCRCMFASNSDVAARRRA